jgi:regulator of protease activity HflC (stomatin/prohibitin superfamily)
MNVIQNRLFQKLAIVGIIILMLLGSSFRIVESGYVGIRVRLGKVSNQTTSEGINMKVPFIERIEKMSIRVQKTEVTTNSSSKDFISSLISSMSSDLSIK